jgi:hypothetical protein
MLQTAFVVFRPTGNEIRIQEQVMETIRLHPCSLAWSNPWSARLSSPSADNR